MGVYWSNLIKDDSPFHTGVNSKNQVRHGNDLSNLSGKSANRPPTPRNEGEILESCNLKSFTFCALKMATRNFHPDGILGEGGFGCVFMGWIDEHSLMAANPGTGLVIAVKNLNQEGFQGHKEWLAEINYLGQLHHPNLVKLIGYCLEDDHRLLVYEFMPKGSMDNHLFRRGTHFQPLSWSRRMKVALGAAKGLAFLHSSETEVIYRDFKTSNILLDSNYTAKLSDFGLARDGPTGDKSHVSTRVMGTFGYAAPDYLSTGIFSCVVSSINSFWPTGDKSHVSTRVMGTFGYAAPDYLSTGHLTAKSDVYSFGVVLLEMLTGERAINNNRPQGQQSLVKWAMPYLAHEREILRILDARIEGQYSLSEALKAGNLALQCLSKEPKTRPIMDEVVTALEQLQDSK